MADGCRGRGRRGKRCKREGGGGGELGLVVVGMIKLVVVGVGVGGVEQLARGQSQAGSSLKRTLISPSRVPPLPAWVIRLPTRPYRTNQHATRALHMLLLAQTRMVPALACSESNCSRNHDPIAKRFRTILPATFLTLTQRSLPRSHTELVGRSRVTYRRSVTNNDMMRVQLPHMVACQLK